MSAEVRPDVPTWAAWARTAVRATVVLYVLSWLVTSALYLSNLILDTTFLEGDSTVWSKVAFGGLVAVGAVGGLAWLAGEMVTGYREPKSGDY